jgi:PKHD-type hydroxylase
MNNDPQYHRKLTAVVQLTDPLTYEGGNLQLFSSFEPDKSDMRAQGTTVFFPSFLDHQAHPVTKGTRYSLACWFDGPKWR